MGQIDNGILASKLSCDELALKSAVSSSLKKANSELLLPHNRFVSYFSILPVFLDRFFVLLLGFLFLLFSLLCSVFSLISLSVLPFSLPPFFSFQSFCFFSLFSSLSSRSAFSLLFSFSSSFFSLFSQSVLCSDVAFFAQN